MKRKIKKENSNIINIEPIIQQSLSLVSINKISEEQMKNELIQLEYLIVDISKQLQFHYQFHTKSKDETLDNIFYLLKQTLKKDVFTNIEEKISQ